jgi:hypothetical protein
MPAKDGKIIADDDANVSF